MEIPPEPPAGTPEYSATLPTKEERTWAMAAHLSALAFHLFPLGGHIIGPLVIWLIKRDSSDYIDDQGKEALNAQISFTIYSAIAAVFVIILVGFAFLFALWLADIILIIVAAIAANEGRRYRYPMIFRLVK
ncbi:MAG: DUF4870 domain-containing protein [Verrucomicrobiota bacterium]